MVTAQIALALLEKHGPMCPQQPSDWAGSFSLPVSLVKFYQEVGPCDVTIEGHGNPFFLPRLAALWEHQLGYRWNLSGEPCESWADDWIVVAHECEGAFILSRDSGLILHDLHGGGAWEPTMIFPDLNTMAACLATLGSLVALAGKDFTDAEFNIRPEYVERAVVMLQQYLSSAAAARFVMSKLGWVA